MIYFIFILLSLCGLNLSQKSDGKCTGIPCNRVSMPMVDRAKAALIADLDMTEMNKVLKAYIDQEVNESVASALKSAIDSVIANISREIEERISHTTTDIPRVRTSTYVDNSNTKDCSDIKEKKKTNGVYHIYPTGKPGYKVYCDMTTDGGGWTVFQRRINGQVSFYDKLWVDYANGFGQVDQEYWLGNDQLHQLTTNGTYVLRINIMDWSNQSKYAVYDNFKVDNGKAGYKLHLGRYHGTAGDSMKSNNKMVFTTIDKQNDGRVKESSCASVKNYRGAWWYPYDCGYSNLNGEYVHQGTGLSRGRGIHWQGFRGFSYSLKQTQMMIRRQ